MAVWFIDMGLIVPTEAATLTQPQFPDSPTVGRMDVL